MYMDETGHISNFFSNKPHSNSYYNGENKGGEGEGEVEINYMYTWVTTCLNEIKKGGETSKSKIL